MTPAGYARSMRPFASSHRLNAWLDRWGGILPLLLAEFIVWLGFGALLPVLPLYFTDQGVDLALLGIVIAAWPAARLIGEPIFGWLADRTARVPLMVAGLLATGLFCILPLALTGPVAFIVLRACAGLSTALYDPAARGYLTDATPPARRGEAFGLYGAVQMGGLLLGPAIGGLGAHWFGGIAFVFVFSGIAAWLAAIPIALRGQGDGACAPTPRPAPDATQFPRGAVDHPARRCRRHGRSRPGSGPSRPRRTRSPLEPRADRGPVINAGGYFAGGTYEVIWSLFLTGLGASIDLVGLTFAMFGLPVLLLSPYAGRLVDRRGSRAFIVIGSILPAAMGLVYSRMTDPTFAVPLIMVEATGFAMLNPALYAVVAANSPVGRSSTAQGLFGAAGTVGFIVASLIAGDLAPTDIVYPMYVFAAVLAVTLVLGLLVGEAGCRVGARRAADDVTSVPV